LPAKPTLPIQVAFQELRGMLIGKISVARGEAPVYMLDGVVYLRQGSSDVQAQPGDIISLVAEFAFSRPERASCRSPHPHMILITTLTVMSAFRISDLGPTPG
jgi:predicted HTH transcriptional regulator